MPIRLRKFIGAVAFFVLVTVWALVAMALAQAPAIRDNTVAVHCLLRHCRPGLGFAGDADRDVDERRANLSDYQRRRARESRSTSPSRPDSSTRT